MKFNILKLNGLLLLFLLFLATLSYGLSRLSGPSKAYVYTSPQKSTYSKFVLNGGVGNGVVTKKDDVLDYQDDIV